MRCNECKHYSYNPFQQREGEENFCKNIRSLTKFLFMIRGILSNREGGGDILGDDPHRENSEYGEGGNQH